MPAPKNNTPKLKHKSFAQAFSKAWRRACAPDFAFTEKQAETQLPAPKNNTPKLKHKSFAQAFSKACRFQGRRPWSRSAEREISMIQALRRGESKNSPVDCFLRGDALRKRASPTNGQFKSTPTPRGGRLCACAPVFAFTDKQAEM